MPLLGVFTLGDHSFQNPFSWPTQALVKSV